MTASVIVPEEPPVISTDPAAALRAMEIKADVILKAEDPEVLATWLADQQPQLLVTWAASLASAP